MKDEGSVNGVWNAVLHQSYPTANLQYVIAPELRIHDTSRTDLIVHSFAYTGDGAKATPFLLFEGKGSGGDTWERIESQLSTYLETLLSGSQKCWAIGARGKDMKLWRFHKANADHKKFLPWRVDKNTAKEVARGTGPKPYSVVDDYGDVRILMDFIATHLDPNTVPDQV